MSSRILPKLAAATSAVFGTLLAANHLENERTPLSPSCKCNASSVPEALDSLQTNGVAIVDNLRLPPKDVRAIMTMPGAESMPHELKRAQPRRRGPPGANLTPAEETWRLSAVGRYHRTEPNLGKEDIDMLESIEERIWPLVQAFFLGEKSVGETSSTANDVGIYRSELQLMTAVPGSGNQSWHRDNRSRGLSIIVPLVDFSTENGGTQLLLGSHEEPWSLGGARVVHASAGSVVAYDSRTIHRGLGNETAEGRPAIIFCYDRIESPPPGCGTLGSIGTSYQGRLLDALSGVRSILSPD